MPSQTPAPLHPSHLISLLRGNPQDLREWVGSEDSPPRHTTLCLLVIIIGFAFYGATAGLMRGSLMAGYVAIKMPLLIFLTLACNGLMNGMLGLLLGSGLGLRQSLRAQLVSFATAGMILGSLTPVTFFLALNEPEYSSFVVLHTALIAYAGVMANLHLFRILLATTPDRRTAGITLATWLSGNAFVGAQFSWILRPFFGGPGLKTELLRDDPMKGTFYEAFWNSLEGMSGNYSLLVLSLILVPLFLALKRTLSSSKN